MIILSYAKLTNLFLHKLVNEGFSDTLDHYSSIKAFVELTTFVARSLLPCLCHPTNYLLMCVNY